jgi:hypothetical protein
VRRDAKANSALLAAVLLAGGSVGAAVHAAEPPGAEKEALKYEAPKGLTGEIYAEGAGPKKLLFKFKRVATRSGTTLDVRRDYTYPDGKIAAREHVVYDGDNLALFELEDLQTGAVGRAKILRAPGNSGEGNIEFEYTEGPASKNKPEKRSEPLAQDTLINDMVAPFLLAHWDALMRGKKVRCRYIVIPRMETVGFTFSKAADSTWQGREAVIVKMAATSIFVGAMVEPLFFTMEKAAPHHVLQYKGRTTPRIQSGGKWKDLDALTVFDW